MITKRHDIVSEHVHERARFLALILGVEERALELVARVEQEDVVLLASNPVDYGRATRHASEALAGSDFFLAACVSALVDLHDSSVSVVCVQDCESEQVDRSLGCRFRSGRLRAV